MKVFITATFEGLDTKTEIEYICSLVRTAGFADFCFIRDVENYRKIFNDPHELMQRAKEEISKCDVLLIEYDGPGHGRMVELGIAYALNKKVILITKAGTFIKDSILGVADEIIEYNELNEIVPPLSQIKNKWM